MRDRPFLSAHEAARPYSEVVAERRLQDAALRRRDQLFDEIAELEGAAAGVADAGERRRLQCEAEALRCALAENPR